MAHFHITAVFESRGASQTEAERAASAALSALRHPRMHYYEQDTSGGLGPYAPGQSLYFTTIAEFDVEAYTEEKAVELAEDLLDRFSTEDIQYLGHGVIPGSPRVTPEDRRAAREEERQGSADIEEEQGEREERSGKGRRSQRGRGRGRKSGRREAEGESIPEERNAESTPAVESLTPQPVAVDAPSQTEETISAPASVTRTVKEEPPSVPVTVEIEEPVPPPPPPPRSSAAMRVTVRVNLRVSELIASPDQEVPADEELIALAGTEARRRHPDLPAEVSPESTIAALPAGDRLISLTWNYEAPVPSAAE